MLVSSWGQVRLDRLRQSQSTTSCSKKATGWAPADQEALAWLTNQAAPNAQGGTSNTNTTQLAAPESAVNLNMGTLVGSYESVARMLDEVAGVPDTKGVLLVFDDFVQGVEAFGTKIQPKMKSRAGVNA